MLMLAYSIALGCGLLLSAPWWLVRMATTKRYREGLLQRVGYVPAALRSYAAGHRILWLHAVSVGEVLAASRLINELEAALGADYRIVISTTTRTGQALARSRFADEHGTARVFYMPLDFAFAVRAYLRALRPEALILTESELWPRLLHECERRSIPVAVVNARMSDRSFHRAERVRSLWSRVLRKPTLWVAQSDEDAQRLLALGARRETMYAVGNLKYDVTAAENNAMARRLRLLLGEARMFVAGSTLAGEEEILLALWPALLATTSISVLMLAPRHPERFDAVAALVQASGLHCHRCSQLSPQDAAIERGTVLLLDTIGDLAAVYALGSVAFVGGSLVQRGGHNPLEPAQHGVPVIMGASYTNFRDIVGRMRAANAISIVHDAAELEREAAAILTQPGRARAVGECGRSVFLAQQGATARTVAALMHMIGEVPR
jgi:3-deoxy-D-manno-octulosonic-acid transferase